jgi:DNA-binding NtrC family response regulator
VEILVIDNDDQYLNAQCRWLEHEGHGTRRAATSKQARSILEKEHQSIAIALVDMYIEEKESGLELIKLMTREYPWVVSIVVTAYADLANAARCMEAGSFSYLPKGVTPPELLRETLKKAEDYGRLHQVTDRVESALRPLETGLEQLAEVTSELSCVLQRILDELKLLRPPSAGPGSDPSMPKVEHGG